MELIEMMKKRRSVRSYTEEPIPADKLNLVLQAGLLAPSGRAIRPWELIVVENKEMLAAMAECREGAAQMLKGAAAAIVVIADPEKTDVWTEDCSIVMAHMHLMADSLGLGSCWIQGRLRTVGGDTTENYLRSLLKFPDSYRLEAILSLGCPAAHPAARTTEELPMEKVHRERY